jgi:DNA-binding HxlR family transcriptional regulator
VVRPTSDRLGRALDLLGDQWVLLMLQQAFFGVRRYNDWKRTLGISDAVLAARLRSLVDAGVFYRRPYRDERRMRDEYRLTDAGLALWQVLVAIWAWEYRFVPGRTDELPVLFHDLCGDPTLPDLICRNCGQTVTARDTEAARERRVGEVTAPRRFRRSGWESIADRPELFFPETMTILGDRWSTAVTAAAFLGVRRFSELERELGIQPSVLSQRLSDLVDHGVLERRQEDGRRAVEYRLTEKGLAFFPVIALVIAWADRWFKDVPRALTVTHRACGETLHPALACDRCGVRLERTQIHFAALAGRSAPGSVSQQDRRPSPTAR